MSVAGMEAQDGMAKVCVCVRMCVCARVCVCACACACVQLVASCVLAVFTALCLTLTAPTAPEQYCPPPYAMHDITDFLQVHCIGWRTGCSGGAE